jgi:hypothetical protein
MPRSSKWSLPFRFPNQNIVRISHLSHACYTPRPSHPPWFHRPNNILRSVQVLKLSLVQPPATSSLSGPNILLTPLFSDTLKMCANWPCSLLFNLSVTLGPPPCRDAHSNPAWCPVKDLKDSKYQN